MAGALPVLVNAAGGTARAEGARLREDVERAFAEAGLAIDLRLLGGEEIARAVAGAHGAIVIVGGGDGTLCGAAGVLAERGATLGILPLGTHNHLAKELGIPADLAGAARLIAAGTTRRIDLGRVNGRVFVNNASVGLYPALVRRREAVREARGWPKWLANIPATYATLKRLRHHRLRVRIGEAETTIATPVLFVGNNRYSLGAGAFGSRAALDDGRLSIYALGSRQRRALLGTAWRTLFGRDEPTMLGEAPSVRVDGHGASVSIALDGEVQRLAFPLLFETMPRALTVIAPSA